MQIKSLPLLVICYQTIRSSKSDRAVMETQLSLGQYSHQAVTSLVLLYYRLME
jgi:hypothetical protein